MNDFGFTPEVFGPAPLLFARAPGCFGTERERFLMDSFLPAPGTSNEEEETPAETPTTPAKTN